MALHPRRLQCFPLQVSGIPILRPLGWGSLFDVFPPNPAVNRKLRDKAAQLPVTFTLNQVKHRNRLHMRGVREHVHHARCCAGVASLVDQ